MENLKLYESNRSVGNVLNILSISQNSKQLKLIKNILSKKKNGRLTGCGIRRYIVKKIQAN